MIAGVGLDLCLVSRLERALSRNGNRFAARLFTDGERRYCETRAIPAQHFAARFAAKEAALKALSVPAGLSWHELEVVHTDSGQPKLALHGAAKDAAQARGICALHLSVTHQGDAACAVVIAEKTELPSSSIGRCS